MKIMQMTTSELSVYLRELAEDNPLIDIDKISEYDLFFDGRSQSVYSSPGSQAFSVDGGEDWKAGEEELCHNMETLQEHLLMQLLTHHLNRRQKQVCCYMIYSVDEDGFLTLTTEEILNSLHITENELAESLSLLQSFDPPGVCAANLEECLQIQARQAGYSSTVIQMIAGHLNDLAKGHYSTISRKLKISVEEVRQSAEFIARLNPIPARGLQTAGITQYLVPDIEIKEQDGLLKASLCRSFAPMLHINPYYSELIRTTDDETVRDYLSRKQYSIKLAEQCVLYRERMLQSCADALLELQTPYFKGTGSLNPLSIKDVAEKVGLDTSTVSRALRGKYIQCRYGIIPARALFSRQASATVDREYSSASAKEELLALIKNENKRKPFSDQKLADILAEKGYRVSRRVITKYREQLGVPSTYLRQSKD